MNYTKLEIAQTITRTLENISEILLEIQDDVEDVDVTPYMGCAECQPEVPEHPETISDLPTDLLTLLNQIRNQELIEVPEHVKDLSNEEAEIAGVAAGVEAALKAIFGSNAKVTRVR